MIKQTNVNAQVTVSLVTYLTLLNVTPDASNHLFCKAYIKLSGLSGSGGNYELKTTVGGNVVQPNPSIINIDSETAVAFWTKDFVVEANEVVLIELKSPNAAETSISATCELYAVCNVDIMAVSGDSTAADDMELFIEALGTDDKVKISIDAQDLSGTLDVNTKTITANAIDSNAIATDALGALELGADAGTEIAAAVAAVILSDGIPLDGANLNSISTDWLDGGRLDLILDAIVADTNELQTDWTNGGRLDTILDSASGSAGSGLIAHTYTVTDNASDPMDGVEVIVTSDILGQTRVASGTTGILGTVVFMLDAGTYYFWKQIAGYSDDENPDTEVVA